MADRSALYYVPSRVHKKGWSEAGSPGWYPGKSPCPDDFTSADSRRLLKESYAEDEEPLNPHRWAARRTFAGVEFYESKSSDIVHADGRIEVHGHPTVRVPPRVLRAMRNAEVITPSEYNRFRKELN